MTIRLLCVAGVLMLVMGQSAAAKMIQMGAQSRSAVATACERAHGLSYGLDDDTAEYGCYAANATITCSPDAACYAAMRDMAPTTGNSLNRLLGLTSSGGPIAIQPLERSIRAADKPAYQSSYRPSTP